MLCVCVFVCVCNILLSENMNATRNFGEYKRIFSHDCRYIHTYIYIYTLYVCVSIYITHSSVIHPYELSLCMPSWCCYTLLHYTLHHTLLFMPFATTTTLQHIRAPCLLASLRALATALVKYIKAISLVQEPVQIWTLIPMYVYACIQYINVVVAATKWSDVHVAA